MVVVCTFGAFCLSLFHHFDRLCFSLAAVKLGEVQSCLVKRYEGEVTMNSPAVQVFS